MKNSQITHIRRHKSKNTTIEYIDLCECIQGLLRIYGKLQVQFLRILNFYLIFFYLLYSVFFFFFFSSHSVSFKPNF